MPYLGQQTKVFQCPEDKQDYDREDQNKGLSYFESERSSYEYRAPGHGNPWLGGQTILEVANRINGRRRETIETVATNQIWVMRDYWNFHGPGGKPGARRYLYMDGHVTDYEGY